MKKDYKDLFHFHGIPAATVSELCRVSVRTVHNWATGKTRPPPAALSLIELHSQGRIMPGDWSSIRFCRDGLSLGNGVVLTRSELAHYHMICEGWKASTLAAIKQADRARQLEREKGQGRTRHPGKVLTL
jgi:hypothetical protein